MSRFQLDNPFLYNIGIRQAVFWDTDTKSGGGSDDNDNDNDNDSDANNPNADASTATSGSTFDMNDPSTWASPSDDTNSLVTGSASSSSQRFFNEANQGSNFSNTQDNIGPAQDNSPNAEEADNPANNNAVGFTEAPGGFGETVTYESFGGNTSGGSGMTFGSTPVGDLTEGNKPVDTGGGGQVNNPNDNTGGGGQDNNPNDNTGGSGMTFGDTPVGDLSQGNNTGGGSEGESTADYNESSETTGAPVPYMEGDILMGTDGRPFTGTYNGTAYQSGVKIITGTETTDTSSPYNDDTLYQRNGLIYIGDPANGVLANGTIGGLNYNNGKIVGGSFGDDDDGGSVVNTGDFTFDGDGNLLQDGNLFTGEYNGQNYVDGVLQTDGDGDIVTAGDQTLTVEFPDGTIVTGTVNADGNVTDADGNIIGTWDGTTFTRSDGITTTATLQSVSIDMNDGSTLNGYLDGSGNVVDANGNVLGTINDQGEFVRAGTSVTEGGGTVDGGSTGSVDTGYSISGGIIYDSNGNIIGYEDGYKDDTETLAENLESATGTSTAGMSRAEIIAMIEEYMMSYNNANYDPAAFMNAFGFALDPNFAGGVIPSFFEGSKAGVYLRRLVKDRDTGELRYVDVPIGGAFGSGLSARMQRRQGFGQALQF